VDKVSPWDALNIDNSAPDPEKEQKRLEIKRRFRECFSSDNGQWVLEFLNGRYFNRPVVDENAVNVLAVAGIREGELRMLRYIHLMMQMEK
jgi:hypothetical protein